MVPLPYYRFDPINKGKKILKEKRGKIMDLRKLDSVTKSEEGVWVPILLNGERTGIEFKIKGIDSKAFKSQSNAIRKYVQSKEKKHENTDVETMNEKMIQLIASITVDWRDTSEEGVKKGADKSGLIVDGEVLKFNLENAITVYTSYPMIADQIASDASDRSNFLA